MRGRTSVLKIPIRSDHLLQCIIFVKGYVCYIAPEEQRTRVTVYVNGVLRSEPNKTYSEPNTLCPASLIIYHFITIRIQNE